MHSAIGAAAATTTAGTTTTSSSAPSTSGRCNTQQAYRCWGRGSSSPWGRAPQARRGRKVMQAEAVSSSSRKAVEAPSTTLPHPNSDKDENGLHSLLNRVSRLDVSSEQQRHMAGHQQDGQGSSAKGVPVYVMLPLDSVWLIDRDDGSQVAVIKREKDLELGLKRLQQAGVEGVMVDVWWGIVEREPGAYDFSAYERLFQKVGDAGLKIQAVMSFHAAGGNVGDTCKIPLPRWVLELGDENPDIFYTDRAGFRNRECLSLGCDEASLFHGRSPVDLTRDFVAAFADVFEDSFGNVITEITVGLGPAGELRYPSYPEGDGRWRFPGVGEFQCYDRYLLADLERAAKEVGQPEWGLAGPHDAGTYNSRAGETGFFCDYGSWNTEYGRFFLGWYCGLLAQHADRMLSAASAVLTGRGRRRVVSHTTELEYGREFKTEPAIKLGIKLAGVHWWYRYPSHAAELTAGYYNTFYRDGYGPILDVVRKHNARVSFTCVEMRDCEHPNDAMCSPEGLLRQVIMLCRAKGVPLSGENALQRYDQYAFDRIAESALGQNARAGHLEQLTFLRMGDLMFDNWPAFSGFMHRMRGGT